MCKLINPEENTLLTNSEYLDLSSETEKDDQHKSMTIMHLNIHGLISKLTELKFLNLELYKHNFGVDIILLCETFLNERNAKLCNLLGYEHQYNTRKTKKGGGVSILIKNGLSYKRRPDLEINKDQQFESEFLLNWTLERPETNQQ